MTGAHVNVFLPPPFTARVALDGVPVVDLPPPTLEMDGVYVDDLPRAPTTAEMDGGHEDPRLL